MDYSLFRRISAAARSPIAGAKNAWKDVNQILQ
jgi:hypothetical protein